MKIFLLLLSLFFDYPYNILYGHSFIFFYTTEINLTLKYMKYE